MDEEALRAMLPMSFGGKSAKRRGGGGVNARRKAELLAASKRDEQAAAASAEAAAAANAAAASRDRSAALRRKALRAARRGSDSGDSEGSGDGGNGGNGEGEAAPVVGPAVPAGRRKKRTTSERDGNADGVTSTATPGNGGGSGGGTLPNHFPVSHEVVLEDMTRAALCVAFDPSGARVACGGNSYELNIYTFGTMGRSKKRTKATMPEPEGGHPVRSISYGYGGAVYAVATTSNQIRVFNAESKELCASKKGDPYIRDRSTTRGHVSGVCNVLFSPADQAVLVSGSDDGTVRTWHFPEGSERIDCARCWRVRDRRGRPVIVTRVAVPRDGRYLGAGDENGTISLFDPRRRSPKPAVSMVGAHEAGVAISGLVFSDDATRLYSRSMDATLKVWDVRRSKVPIAAVEDLPNRYAQTSVILSPDGDYVITGTSVVNKQGLGRLCAFETSTMTPVGSIAVSPESVIAIEWNKRINQIAVGCGTGSVHVLYDPDLSKKGALISVLQPERRLDASDLVDFSADINLLGNAEKVTEEGFLMEFRPKNPIREHYKARKKAGEATIPERPQHDDHLHVPSGGFESSAMLQMDLLKRQENYEDPREAMFAEDLKADVEKGKYTGGLYGKPIFADISDDEDEGKEEDGSERPPKRTKWVP